MYKNIFSRFYIFRSLNVCISFWVPFPLTLAATSGGGGGHCRPSRHVTPISRRRRTAPAPVAIHGAPPGPAGRLQKLLICLCVSVYWVAAATGRPLSVRLADGPVTPPHSDVVRARPTDHEHRFVNVLPAKKLARVFCTPQFPVVYGHQSLILSSSSRTRTSIRS